jgi:serine/threonine protein kinase/CheY-like chemotaxis protein
MPHILVVEDDFAISDQLRTILEANGYKVTVCNDGGRADYTLMNSDFDLLMLDWDLPGMNGPDVLKNYRTRGGLSPVLMLTGKSALESKEMAFEAGADDYMIKPFLLREVVARVKAMLRRTEQLTESLQAAAAPKIVARDAQGDPFLNTVFAGKYKLNQLLGEGGNGSVYGGIHLGLNRPIAVKFLHSFLITRTEARVRFQREAQALSEIDHPGIIRVFDYGIEQGQPYMVLEKLDGIPLSEIIQKEGPRPLGEALPIFALICDAMDFAHNRGILHRDLKPENVMISKDDKGSRTIKILDLGLSRDMKDEARITETGITLGTAHYMSPEQCQGKTTDPRSDIYSMGCLMYETLTGSPPFDGKEYVEVFMKHIKDAPPPFASKIADRMKAGRVEQVVLKTLAKNPANRPQSFAELKQQLPLKAWF